MRTVITDSWYYDGQVPYRRLLSACVKVRVMPSGDVTRIGQAQLRLFVQIVGGMWDELEYERIVLLTCPFPSIPQDQERRRIQASRPRLSAMR